MSLQLKVDIAESRETACPYAGVCSIMNGRTTKEQADLSERHYSICATEARKDCSEYKSHRGTK